MTGTALVPVSAQRHPFAPPDQWTVEGLSLLEIVRQAGIPDPFLDHVELRLSGETVHRIYWRNVRPKPGRLVEVMLVPQGPVAGGGGGGKNPLRTVLTIAIVAGALAVTGGALAPAFGAAFAAGGTGALIAGAGIAIAGQLLVNSLIPVRPPQIGGINSAEDVSGSKMQFIEGARNQPQQWGSVPVVYGAHRMVPPYGAKPYTRISGKDQYLHMLFVWGYGPLDISLLKIGETPIAQFEGVRVQHRNGEPAETPLTIFSNDVVEEDLAVAITNAGGFERRVTAPDADEIGVDITLGRGLVRYNDQGDKLARSVQISIRFRKVGDATWLPPVFDETGVPNTSINQLADRTQVTFTGKTNDPLRFGFTWTTAQRASYEVEMTRATADTTNSRIFDEVTWTALRRIKDDDPIKLPYPLARTALRIKATDQLNSVIDELSGLVRIKCRDWNGSSWVAGQITSNPASHFRHVLHEDNSTRLYLPLSRIDDASLQDWHDFCVAENLEFNMVRDYPSSVRELLHDIAAAGRAMPVLDIFTGKWGVRIDRAGDLPVQHFTPRNSNGFKARKLFNDVPDAFRVRFPNANAKFRASERIVYNDGFTSANATKFERLELIGVTEPSQIHKLTRYHLKTLKLRPEEWSFTADFEHLRVRPGEYFLITHDVLLVGLAAGRIKTLVTDGGGDITGIVSDEQLVMEAGKSYGLSVRTSADAAVTATLVTVAGSQTTVSFASPLTAGTIAAGDLFGFGETGAETIEAICREIEREDDDAARITCVPRSAQIYDDGAIPEYDPGLTPIADLPAPSIVQVRTGETDIIRGEGTRVELRLTVEVKPLNKVDPGTGQLVGAPVEGVLEAQTRPSSTNQPFRAAQVVERTTISVSLSGVRRGETWDVRVRWREGTRVGPWAEANNNTVIIADRVPAALQGLTISALGGQALIRWREPDDLDIRLGGIVLFRHSKAFTGALWSSAASIGQSAQAKSLVAVLPLKPGTYLARVFDADGTAGAVASVTTKQASVHSFASTATIDEAPGFNGTHVDTEAVGGTLRLADDGTGGGGGGAVSGASAMGFVPGTAVAGLAVPGSSIEATEPTGGGGGTGATGVLATGTYGFANSLDLGAVTRIRLTTRLIVGATNPFDQIDSRTELIDDWDDFDGVDQSSTDVEVWCRQTDDDPGVSPTWSAWDRLDSAEFEARAFEFEARLSTADSVYNISISEMGIDAEAVV